MSYDIKYIYFEVYWIDGDNPINPTLQNENALMFKPHTNSNGVWGYRNVTETKGRNEFVTVDQTWVDLEKYKPYEHYVDINGGKFLEEAISKLNKKLRKPKLEQIESNI